MYDVVSHKLLIGLSLVGMTTLSACVTAQDFTSNVNPDNVQYSASAAKDITRIYAGYSDCLSDSFFRISEQRLKNNDLPDMRAKTYEDQCIREEVLLYQAFYSAARDHDPTGPEEFAHNTALKGVEQVKQITFDAIAEGFQPPQ